MGTVEGYRSLEVWQRGMQVAREVYEVTRGFPEEERFGLTTQLRRAAVSIPSNFAEGWGRAGRKEFARFLRIARGSGHEVETQLLLAHQLGLLDAERYERLNHLLDVQSRQLLSFLRKL